MLNYYFYDHLCAQNSQVISEGNEVNQSSDMEQLCQTLTQEVCGEPLY
jgi:uncharacterized membrane protein affecting hemolysin expression